MDRLYLDPMQSAGTSLSQILPKQPESPILIQVDNEATMDECKRRPKQQGVAALSAQHGWNACHLITEARIVSDAGV
jgi:hypothetical protein